MDISCRGEAIGEEGDDEIESPGFVNEVYTVSSGGNCAFDPFGIRSVFTY